MANQQPVQETKALPEDESPLLAVRRRGAFLITAVLWAAALGGAVVLGGYFVIVFNEGLDAGERLREALGLQVPAEGPDWYLLAVMVLVVSVPLGIITLLWLWYGKIWRRRLRRVWTDRADMKRYARLKRLAFKADAKEREGRARYLKALLASPAWQGFAPAAVSNPAAGNSAENRTGPVPVANAEEYRRQAEKVLREIEDDVAERAIATGLIVGLGPSRMDRFTIVIAALEMQLHVLSRLGKKPSFGAWQELLKRTSASFFFNTYLNREDALIVSYTIRKMALGLAMTAEMAQDAAEALQDGDDSEEAMDEAVEELGGIPMLGGVLKTAGSMSLGVGAFGLQQIADLTREAGDELLQGALAGGVLYYHGMAIAADALALDEGHRHSPEMTRTPRQGAMRAAVVAGQLLRSQVKRYRGAYRERRRAPLRLVTRYAPRWGASKGQQPEMETIAQQAPAEIDASKVSMMQPWRFLRRPPQTQRSERSAENAPEADASRPAGPERASSANRWWPRRNRAIGKSEG